MIETKGLDYKKYYRIVSMSVKILELPINQSADCWMRKLTTDIVSDETSCNLNLWVKLNAFSFFLDSCSCMCGAQLNWAPAIIHISWERPDVIAVWQSYCNNFLVKLTADTALSTSQLLRINRKLSRFTSCFQITGNCAYHFDGFLHIYYLK